MAHRSFTLSALKLTKHPVAGPKSVSYISTVLPGQESTSGSQYQAQDVDRSYIDMDTDSTACPFEPDDSSYFTEPTGYELERKASILGWQGARKAMLEAVVEAAGEMVTL